MTDPQQCSGTRLLLAIALLTLVYIATGWLGLQLALPPGYVTAVFPPAGISLAALLLYGWRLWPGVFLGSLGLNVLVAWLTATPGWQDIALALVIALGSSLQCLCAYGLIQRFLPGARFLDGNERIIPLLLIGGPLACLVASSVGSLALLFFERLSWSGLPYSLWSWWVGDTIGVFLFAPLSMVLARLPGPDGRRQALTIILPSFSMIAIVVALFFQSNNWENQRLEAVFRSQARSVAENLTRDVDRYQDAVAEVRRLYESSEQVTPAEFQRFTHELLQRSPGIRALEYVPVVRQDERAAFEQQARELGLSGFAIRELSPEGQRQIAGRRPVYFPVFQLAPYHGNEAVLGLDLGADRTRRAALERARELRRPVATPGIVIINDQQLGVLLFNPVFAAQGVHAQAQLRGVALGVFNLKTVVSYAVPQEVAADIDVELYDVTTPTQPQPLYVGSPRSRVGSSLQWQLPVSFADREWRVLLIASETFLARQRSLVSWLVLAGGLLFTGVLQMLLLMMTGHTRSVEARVQERTRALAHSEERFRAVFNDNPDAILVVDHRGCIVGSNARAVSLFGYGREALEGSPIELLMPDRLRRAHEHHREGFFKSPQMRAMGAGLALFGRRADGTEFPLDVMISPMRLGEQTLAIAIVRDITERKRLEQAREESEARFRAVAETASDAMISCDEQGRMIFANPAAERMFAYRQDELMGQPLSLLMPAAPAASELPTDAGELAAAVTARRRDGSYFPIEVSEAAWALGGARYVTTIIRDITQRRAQDEKLNNALREKDTLLKEVYHRVKNNLQVIQSLLNLEARGLADGPARQAMADMGSRIRAMALVHEKLYQSRNLASISLADYINDLIRQLQNAGAIDSRRIQVELDVSNIDVGLESAIPLGLLLNELVSNALKHGFPGERSGRIRITLQPRAQGARLTVADTGVGLPADFDLSRINTMGLKLATSLARQLGGQLQMQSAGGCTVSLDVQLS